MKSLGLSGLAAIAALASRHPDAQGEITPADNPRAALADSVRKMARQAQDDLFRPIRKKGGYGKKLAAHFAAKRLLAK